VVIYNNELEKENGVLFVMGFSFADEHIRELTLRVANTNPTSIIYIFVYDKGAVFTFSSSGLDFSTVAIGDSIAVNGVCLTVIEIEKECFTAHWHQIIPIPKKNKPKA
jgi:hypothetical protein